MTTAYPLAESQIHPHTAMLQVDLIQIGRTSVGILGGPLYMDITSLYIRDTITLAYKIEIEINI